MCFVAISLYVQSLPFRPCRLSELTLAEPLISVLVINLGFTVKIVTICHHFLPVKLKFTKNSSPVFQDQAETRWRMIMIQIVFTESAFNTEKKIPPTLLTLNRTRSYTVLYNLSHVCSNFYLQSCTSNMEPKQSKLMNNWRRVHFWLPQVSQNCLFFDLICYISLQLL